MTRPQLPSSWQQVVGAELDKPYFRQLQEFLTRERREHTIYPPDEDIFNALKYTSFPDVRVVILGQDPYHEEDQAHGLAFSVRPGIKPPPSLMNVFQELKNDLGCPIPKSGCLIPWAEQGVLLLNTVLTVRAHEPNSHRGKGWEQFTDAIICAVSNRSDPVAFALWGASAQKKIQLIGRDCHPRVLLPHPSPISARNGFFGSKPFSRINAALRAAGKPAIDWQLPDP
jgi:uracil-DNA glycosylase